MKCRFCSSWDETLGVADYTVHLLEHILEELQAMRKQEHDYWDTWKKAKEDERQLDEKLEEMRKTASKLAAPSVPRKVRERRGKKP